MKPLHVLALIAAAYLVGVCTAPQDTAEVDSLKAQRDVLLEQNDQLIVTVAAESFRADSIQEQYSADSVSWERERSALLSEADQAESDFSATAERLRAIGDSTVNALVRELEAEHNTAVVAYQGAISTLVEERDALLVQRAALVSVIDELRGQTYLQQQIIDRHNDIVQALEDQQGHSTTVVMGAAIVGAVLWELAR